MEGRGMVQGCTVEPNVNTFSYSLRKKKKTDTKGIDLMSI